MTLLEARTEAFKKLYERLLSEEACNEKLWLEATAPEVIIADVKLKLEEYTSVECWHSVSIIPERGVVHE